MAFRSGTVAAGLLAFLVLHPARAEDSADAPPVAVSASTVQDWSSSWFGMAFATPRGDNTWRQASDGLELVPGGWDGSNLVLSLGHVWQTNQVTYGAQVSYGDGQYTAVPTNAAFINCASCETRASDLIQLTGRVGFAAGQTHLFASGGFARANVTATNLFGLLVVGDETMTGWTVGLGVEQRIGDNLSLSVSYDHVDLGTLSLPTYLPTGETEVDLDLVQAGVNVRW